jgi:hypothetical protein
LVAGAHVIPDEEDEEDDDEDEDDDDELDDEEDELDDDALDEEDDDVDVEGSVSPHPTANRTGVPRIARRAVWPARWLRKSFFMVSFEWLR